eukprot:331876-Chlamydomonas_euryale.AAC.1
MRTFHCVVTGRLLTILGPRFLLACADLIPPECGWASLASKAEDLADLVAGCCCCKVNHHHAESSPIWEPAPGQTYGGGAQPSKGRPQPWSRRRRRRRRRQPQPEPWPRQWRRRPQP